jgi:arylsulfatase A-like enzyme
VNRAVPIAVAGVVLAAAAAAAAWVAWQPPGEPARASTSAPGPAPEAARRPNVLVLLWDTTRADRMSLYGHERATTPYLEGLAATSAVYDRAYSPGMWTLPAHASLFTGLPVESTGADERWLWLDSHHVTMAEHFRGHGYQTFAFAANALLSQDTNLLQGFDTVWNSYRGKAKPVSRRATQQKLIARDRSNELAPGWAPPQHGATNAEWAKATYKDAGPVIAAAFPRWLDELAEPNTPFFAYINLMEAHTPRIPSLASREALLDPEMLELGLNTDQGHINLHFFNFHKMAYTPEELQAIRGVYDATLLDLDKATGALLDALDERGVLDETIVVITSDHGENLGDHHLFNHRFVLYDSLLHVPLLIRWPRGVPPARVAQPVSTGDLFATLTDLAGVPQVAPTGSSLTASGGRAPVVSTMALPLEREVRTVQEVHPDVEVEPWMRSGHALVGGRYKLIDWRESQELYDLADDVDELADLAEEGQHGAALTEARALLKSVLDATPPYDPSLRGPADDPKTVRAGQADLRRQLEALGYVTEEPDP